MVFGKCSKNVAVNTRMWRDICGHRMDLIWLHNELFHPFCSVVLFFLWRTTCIPCLIEIGLLIRRDFMRVKDLQSSRRYQIRAPCEGVKTKTVLKQYTIEAKASWRLYMQDREGDLFRDAGYLCESELTLQMQLGKSVNVKSRRK